MGMDPRMQMQMQQQQQQQQQMMGGGPMMGNVGMGIQQPGMGMMGGMGGGMGNLWRNLVSWEWGLILGGVATDNQGYDYQLPTSGYKPETSWGAWDLVCF